MRVFVVEFSYKYISTRGAFGDYRLCSALSYTIKQNTLCIKRRVSEITIVCVARGHSQDAVTIPHLRCSSLAQSKASLNSDNSICGYQCRMPGEWGRSREGVDKINPDLRLWRPRCYGAV